MGNENKISRRKLLKIIASALTLPAAGLWYAGTRQKVVLSSNEKIIIPKNLTDGITFLDKIIINKSGSDLKVFSSKCTHLGCKITSMADGKLVCPCHGSRFSVDGKPRKGPAVTALKSLKVIKDKDGDIVVYG